MTTAERVLPLVMDADVRLADVARSLGIPVNTVRGVVFAARRKGVAVPQRSRPYHVGEECYQWKGDAAPPTTKRMRAQRAYSIDRCERCGEKATDRHHKDGDTGNNVRENLEFLCRRCHMTVDGRLESFKALRYVGPNRHPAFESKPPKPCAHCGFDYKPLRKGLCHACNEYQRRHGCPRPLAICKPARVAAGHDVRGEGAQWRS